MSMLILIRIIINIIIYIIILTVRTSWGAGTKTRDRLVGGDFDTYFNTYRNTTARPC